MKTLTTLGASLLFTASVCAQTRWIVSSAGGPEVLTTIQAALDAAAPGDTIVVQPGSYFEAPATSKGVAILADPGVNLVSLPLVTFSITALPAEQTFSLRGFELNARIDLRDCAGAVHLENVTNPELSQRGGVSAQNCLQVTVNSSRLRGLVAARITDSRVVFAGCDLRAIGMFCCNDRAMTIDDGAVTIVGGRVAGAPSFIAAGSSAIELAGGTLVLAGRDTVIASGQDTSGNPVPAVATVAGHVEVEPAVTLLGQNGAAAIGGPATVTTRRIPSVQSRGLESFGTWSIDLHAPTGSIFSLVTGLPVPPIATIWGELWIDSSAPIVLAFRGVGPGDRFAFSIQLPRLPPGIALVTQAAVASPTTLELTPPAANVTR